MTIVGIAVAAFCLLVLTVAQMNQQVNTQIDRLATATSDSTQWSLAQSDVEVLALLSAIGDARVSTPPDLAAVRTRFDVFFSRATALSTNPLLRPVRENPEVLESLANLDAYLQETVPIVDGEDSALVGALPGLWDRTSAIREDVRLINLKGVTVLSRQSDLQRTGIAATLSRISALTYALFFGLILVVILLLVFFWQASQRAIEQSQMRTRLAAMVSTSLDAVIAVNSCGVVIDFNGAAERIFGYTRDEAIGRKMEDLIVPDHLKSAHQAGMERYRKTRERHVIGKGRVQLEARRKSGEVFPVELSISTAESDEGEIFVSFLRDISRRLESEQELIKARDDAVAGEKAKADFIAVMSHEMRTPLNGMLGTLDLLDPGNDSAMDREYLDIIRASGELLLHHVNNVLDISQAEAGKIEVARTTFSLPALVNELVESQRGLAEHRGNIISKIVETGGCDYAVGDPRRISQVLLNLIGNAIKFTRNGSITVEAERIDDGDMVEFSVIDTGIGIPEKDRMRVFDDFVALDTSLTRAVGGTGLGLAIVRRLVEVMGGEVGLESTDGHGSRFWVRLSLPATTAVFLAETTGPAKDRDPPESPPAPPMKVLVVEDNRINRVVVRDLLEKDGHVVDEAIDGKAGVEAARANPYDIVLMDISMPVMDGIEATREIRKSEPPGTHLPIVALTANAVPSEKDRFFAAGLDGILIKPISLARLRYILTRYSNLAQGSDSLRLTDPGDEMLVDHAHLEELSDVLGAEKKDAMIQSFLTKTDHAMDSIISKLETGDLKDGLREAVHHTAGSSALLGAEVLRAALADLETDLAENRPLTDDAAKTLAEIWSDTAKELRAHGA